MRRKGDRVIKRTTYFGTQLHCGLNEVGQTRRVRERLASITAEGVQASTSTKLPSLRDAKEPKLHFVAAAGGKPGVKEMEEDVKDVAEVKGRGSNMFLLGERKPIKDSFQEEKPRMLYKRANSIELDLPRCHSEQNRRKPSRCSTFIERLREDELSEEEEELEPELEDMMFEMIDFKPENKVLLGRKKLMRGRNRKSIFRSHTCIGLSNPAFQPTTSAFQIAELSSGQISRRGPIVPPPPDSASAKPASGTISKQKQRCRFALKFLHKYVAKIKQVDLVPALASDRKVVLDTAEITESEFDDFDEDEDSEVSKDSKSEISDQLSVSVMKDIIRETSLDPPSLQLTSSQEGNSTEDTSNFSRGYYKHLTTMLEDILAEDEVMELRQSASLSPPHIQVPRLHLPASKTLKSNQFKLITMSCEEQSDSDTDNILKVKPAVEQPTRPVIEPIKELREGRVMERGAGPGTRDSHRETEEIVLSFTRKLKGQHLRHSMHQLPKREGQNWRKWYN